MSDPVIFYIGLFCFIMTIFGVILTIQEFRNIQLAEKVKTNSK